VGSPINVLCGYFDGFLDNVVCRKFFFPLFLEFYRGVAALFVCFACECWDGWCCTGVFYYFRYILYYLIHFVAYLLPLVMW
jgi:hypothetical protein